MASFLLTAFGQKKQTLKKTMVLLEFKKPTQTKIQNFLAVLTRKVNFYLYRELHLCQPRRTKRKPENLPRSTHQLWRQQCSKKEHLKMTAQSPIVPVHDIVSTAFVVENVLSSSMCHAAEDEAKVFVCKPRAKWADEF
mmetsp:Transcript_12566/g.17545  ORF Transcript_12566/g.17545 Transcript_12566/m.17545 type:complete len:138 (+) Transcript_12566:2900-3313(+)